MSCSRAFNGADIVHLPRFEWIDGIDLNCKVIAIFNSPRSSAERLLGAARGESVKNQLSESDPDAAALLLRLLHEDVNHVELGIDSDIGAAAAIPFQLADRTRLVRRSRIGANGKSISESKAITR